MGAQFYQYAESRLREEGGMPCDLNGYILEYHGKRSRLRAILAEKGLLAGSRPFTRAEAGNLGSAPAWLADEGLDDIASFLEYATPEDCGDEGLYASARAACEAAVGEEYLAVLTELKRHLH